MVAANDMYESALSFQITKNITAQHEAAITKLRKEATEKCVRSNKT